MPRETNQVHPNRPGPLQPVQIIRSRPPGENIDSESDFA